MAFAQVAKDEEVLKLFEWGRDLTSEIVQVSLQKLHKENLPTPTFLDDLVTTSTFSPFSDKIMLFHKMDMFAMKIRAFGNAVAVDGRHDIAFMYTTDLMKIGKFVDNAAKLMVKKGWMEQPPISPERGKLSSSE
ncbi:DUF3231 family protein [Bacillus salipaludis]|uniref:DUF3231 family protein n=1 Tax=Bacillus salipaludis TaxID=2547811 RepID=UPI002E1B0937|nr:DUF3231 family protein [Bacillus salipaludis]